MPSKRKKKISKIPPQNYFYAKTKIKKRKKRILFFILYSFLFFAVFGAFIYFLFFTKYFEIKDVSVFGADTISENKVRDIFFSFSDGEKYFISKKNIFVFPYADFSESLKKEFRVVEEVSTKISLPSSVNINIKEYSPKGIICSSLDVLSARCFYFDEKGIVFDKAPVIFGELLLFILDEEVFVDGFPRQVIKKNSIDFITKFKRELSNNENISILYFKFDEEFGDVEVGTENGFKIFLSQSYSPKEQAYAILSVISDRIGDRVSELDYIDLRIKNKAYFKYVAKKKEGDPLNTQENNAESNNIEN